MFKEFILKYSAFVQTKRGRYVILVAFMVISVITYVVISGLPYKLLK